MAAMSRLTFSLFRSQFAWLRTEARRLGVSIGEVVRRIIDAHIREKQP